MNYYNQSQDIGIVFIKNLDELEQDATYEDYDKPFVFANYKIVDKTCDKVLGFKVSQAKAEEKRQKQLGYKKHAKCEVVIEELHLTDKMVMNVRDIFGTSAWYHKLAQFRQEQVDSRLYRKKEEIMAFTRNINITGTVNEVFVDKDIMTKFGLSRMVKFNLKDVMGDEINVTVWGESCNGIVQGATVELRNAEVSTYKNDYGLQVPRYGSITVKSKPEITKSSLPTDGTIIKLVFKSKKEFGYFMEYVEPQLESEDRKYVDFVNYAITISNPSRYKIIGYPISELGSIKNQARTKRIEKLHGVMKDNIVVVGYSPEYGVATENFAYEVVEGDEDKRISFMDKYSWQCAICNQNYGYKNEAYSCSLTHIKHGLILGEIVTSVEIEKA